MVAEARRILGYLTHLTDEMRPPKSIWHSVKQCNEWIDSHRPGSSSNSGMFEFNDHEIQG